MREHKQYPKEWDYYNYICKEYDVAKGLYDEDLYAILSEAEKLPPNANYVEVGVSHGSSLISVAHFRPDINCYGIELATDIRNGHRAIEKEGIKNIELFLGRGSEEVCKQWDREIDLLFIDGEHYFPYIFWDFCGWSPYVKQGSKILFHDYENAGGPKFSVREALQVFKNHQRYEFTSLSEDYVISSSVAILTKK